MTGTPAPTTVTLHATALVLDEVGVLVRGAPGSGKSRIAEALVGEARRTGRFGRLVADDRVILTVAAGRLVARPHLRGAGLVERRGRGIVRVAHEPACVVRLLVDLVSPATLERMPAAPDLREAIAGVELPRLALPAGVSAADAVYRVNDELGSELPRLWKWSHFTC